MTLFCVWVPKATQVEVEVGGERISLTASEGGWWSADVAAARAGTEYRFVLDGNNPLPDPRSPQIGNRAQGERSSQLMGAGRLKVAAALVLTAPFLGHTHVKLTHRVRKEPV